MKEFYGEKKKKKNKVEEIQLANLARPLASNKVEEIQLANLASESRKPRKQKWVVYRRSLRTGSLTAD